MFVYRKDASLTQNDNERISSQLKSHVSMGGPSLGYDSRECKRCHRYGHCGSLGWSEWCGKKRCLEGEVPAKELSRYDSPRVKIAPFVRLHVVNRAERCECGRQSVHLDKTTAFRLRFTSNVRCKWPFRARHAGRGRSRAQGTDRHRWSRWAEASRALWEPVKKFQRILWV